MTRCAIAFSLGAFLALAGCSGGGTTQPAPVCPNVVIGDSQAHLVSPPSGATGVSPSIGSITVTYGSASVLDAIDLTPSDGSPSVPGTAAPNPSNGTAVVTIPALKPAMKYTVTGHNVNFAHIVGCFTPITANFGSFTTQ
jgi:hypothetical protein